MTFKRRVKVLFFCTIFAIIALTASLIAIFANNNLLVKTNVSVTYTAPDLSEAYVATNVWKSGETEKREVLATTNAKDVTTASSVTESLTASAQYMVFEFMVENRSTDKYYFQATFKDTTVTNMKFEYCLVSDEPLEPEEIISADLTTLEYYHFKDSTRLVNNIELYENDKVYFYAVTGVEDALLNASFKGDFACNVSLDPFSSTPQKFIKKADTNSYYIEAGEMPQSFAGTDGSAYTLSEEVYTECGVNYEVYTDESGNKYAKKDGSYYKFEPIIWSVKGISSSSGDTVPAVKYTDGSYKAKGYRYLFVISEKILFTSVWNTTLTRVNYPNSTICAYINEFYNNILSSFSGSINNQTTYYNKVETEVQSTLADAFASASGHISQMVFIPNTTLASHQYFMPTKADRVAYYTDWALGSSTATVGKWWTRTNQYNNADGEIFVANAVDETGNFVATNINEVCGVRPSMIVSWY